MTWVWYCQGPLPQVINEVTRFSLRGCTHVLTGWTDMLHVCQPRKALVGMIAASEQHNTPPLAGC
jgi:hypothetical protein